MYLLIAAGSMIALEILAQRHYDNTLSVVSEGSVEPIDMPVQSSMTRAHKTALDTSSFSSTDSRDLTNDAPEENWVNTKSIIKIIL
jgi:hypothetical protein